LIKELALKIYLENPEKVEKEGGVRTKNVVLITL